MFCLCITRHFTSAVNSSTRNVSDQRSKHRSDRERQVRVNSTRLWTETPETFQSQCQRHNLLSLVQLLTQIRRRSGRSGKRLSHSDRARCCSTIEFSFSRTCRLHLLVQISSMADGVCNSQQQGQAKRAPHAANEASNCYPTHTMRHDQGKVLFFSAKSTLSARAIGA